MVNDSWAEYAATHDDYRRSIERFRCVAVLPEIREWAEEVLSACYADYRGPLGMWE